MFQFLLIAVAAGALYFDSAKKFVESLSFSVTKVSIDTSKTISTSWATLYLDVTITLTNPQNFSATVKSLYLEFYFQKTKIGSVTKVQQFFIPASTRLPVSFAVAIPVVQLWTALKTFFTALQSGVATAININGYVEVPAGKIPITQTVSLT